MTQELPCPVTLVKVALSVLPAAALRPVLAAALHAMQRQHAPLFRRLTRLAPATILLDPVDVPHGFLLRIDPRQVRLDVVGHGHPASASIGGTLETLLALLEGRIDSDTLFFSRAVGIGGDTGVAVGFRNTLDGEPISLLGDALRLAGPFARPGRRAVLALDRHIGGLRQDLMRRHHRLHAAAHDGRNLAAEHDSLAAEVAALRAAMARGGRGVQGQAA